MPIQLYDSRSGGITPVRPARRLLRLAVAAPPGRGQLGDLRALVTGDLIRRNAERQRLAVDLTWPGADDGTRGDGAALGLRPPEGVAGDGDPDLEVGGSEAAAGTARPVRCGPVLFEDREVSRRHPVTLDDLSDDGLDPLALRLAFLGGCYREPLRLTRDGLAGAAAELGRWRHQVATWATHPSRPPSAGPAAQVTTAFDHDLDVPAALAALAALAADPDVPPGAKFETLAQADQLLGLELAREVGRL